MSGVPPGKTPEGICLRCGTKYYGWALEQPQESRCVCGGKIRPTRKVRSPGAGDGADHGNGAYRGLRLGFDRAGLDWLRWRD